MEAPQEMPGVATTATHDTCLYGSVVGLDAMMKSVAVMAIPELGSGELVCDECEEAIADVTCEGCGLVYCAACDDVRHRKGNLAQHERRRLQRADMTLGQDDGSAELGNNNNNSSLNEINDDMRNTTTSAWSVPQVLAWLALHELECFHDEVATHGIDGEFLLSTRMDEFLDTTSSASRGLKKKLSREVQKLKSKLAATTERAVVAPPALSTMGAPAPMSSFRRPGMNLRVNVDVQPAVRAPDDVRFSPVTALRSKINHGQLDDTKGRVNRRRSALPTLETSAPPPAPLEPRRSKSVISTPLRIDVDGPIRNETRDPLETRNELRSGRQAFGGLNLDIMQVKREENAVEASFDFSAEGRLQTQGFDINTRGISNVPFPHQHLIKRAPLGTKEYLINLKELGHGAGGKVYKSLYVPTFKLVATKVIRIFDQNKRHQMVRELKSLYVNFVPITDTTSRSTCDELVVFYDAYTNPEVGSVSIVLEYMDDGSLEDKYMQKSSHKCSEKELANIAYCGLKGLAFLHEHHQLHRDIKPSNMLLNRQGMVKISDFGISRDLESTLAKAATFTGTLLYMAPERISGGMYSYPSDIWSFGLALMACAIGKIPVPTKEGYWGVVHAVQEQPSPKLSDYGDDFSTELCDLLDQCLQKNPMMRPPAAKLLEHPFIKKNYAPAEPAVAQGEVSARAMADLDNIAASVRTWCQEHAETLLSPTAASSGPFHNVPNAVKIQSLADQLHIPVSIVAEKFAFLDSY